MAYLIKAGSLRAEKVTPKNGKYFTLEELQKLVGGYIEYLETRDGDNINMVANEESKLEHQPINLLATALYKWTSYIGKDGQPILNDVVCGDVVYGDLSELDSPDDEEEK